jgi:multiple sugar transport system permease protein
LKLGDLLRKRAGQVCLIVTMFCLLFPVYWLVQSSISTETELFHSPSYLFPPHPSFVGFSGVWPVMGPALRNSAIIAIGTVLVTLLVAVPTAYGLALARVGSGGSVVRLLVLVGLVFPGIMFVIPLYQLFYHLHLLNNLLGLMLADSLYAVPLGTLIVYTYMSTLPLAFTEAARVEGATRGQILRRIIVPLSAPALATTSIFAFLGAWGDYLFAATLTNGGSASPASTAVYSLIGAGESITWPDVMAGSLILGTPAVLAVVFFQRFIRTGLSAGGLVG